jgi:hypothetical protein
MASLCALRPPPVATNAVPVVVAGLRLATEVEGQCAGSEHRVALPLAAADAQVHAPALEMLQLEPFSVSQSPG